MNSTTENNDKTVALIRWTNELGRSQLAEVEVLDWAENGAAMVAHGDGFLVPIYELPGFVCLTGAGVMPGHEPRGRLGSGAARARLRGRSKR